MGMDNTDTTKYDNLPVYCNGVRIDEQEQTHTDDSQFRCLYSSVEEIIEQFDLDVKKYDNIPVNVVKPK
jgi:hypothetical protein